MMLFDYLSIPTFISVFEIWYQSLGLMDEPGFDNCPTCRRLILRRDSLKHSMELLEENIQRKQRNLDLFLNLNLLTEWIHAQIRMIEYNQTTLNIMIQTLANCYTDYGNHLMNEHLNDED